jgi:hypothetical protein
VALSNERLLDVKDGQVTFQWKDYRSKGRQKSRVMTLDADEFIRRFLIHVLPRGFQRIRFFGLLSNRRRKETLTTCRRLLASPMSDLLPNPDDYRTLRQPTDKESICRCPRLRQRRDGPHSDPGPGMATAGFLMMTGSARRLTPVLPFGSERESLASDSQRDDKSPDLRRRSRLFPLSPTPQAHVFGNRTLSCPDNFSPCGISHGAKTKQNP